MPITIIKDFCKGCGFCITNCPKKVYELSGEMNKKGYRLPNPVRIEGCTECGLCDLYCPDFAIVLEKTKKKGKGNGGPLMSSGVKPGRYFAQGDEAIAEGAIAAGCRFFAGYPITLSSETSETMARRLPEVGGICLQMEDELASIHAVGGASVGGLKAMTISSGPGISLKLEGLGWGIKNEIPYVVADIQRAGPSNGVATRVGQGDLYTVRYGSAGGNNCTIALSPQVDPGGL